MDREFERFRGGPNEAASKRIHVTTTPARLIMLNRNMHYQSGRPAAVYLHFSRERDVIALEPAGPRLPEAFPVSPTPATGASTPPHYFGIKIDTTLKFIRPEIQHPPTKTQRNRLSRRPGEEKEKMIRSERRTAA